MTRPTLLLILFIISCLEPAAQAPDSSSTISVLDTAVVRETDSVLTEGDVKAVDSAKYFTQELNFATYLITNDQYNDAKVLLSKIESESISATPDQRDSITYMRGWISYFNRDFNEAIRVLSRVNGNTAIGVQSNFYEAICFVYLTEFDSAKRILADIQLDSGTLLSDLRYLQYASIALLERDYSAYDSVAKHLERTYFEFSTEEQNMSTYHEQLSTYKRKSPFIAGGLSALFPGVGKFYADTEVLLLEQCICLFP